MNETAATVPRLDPRPARGLWSPPVLTMLALSFVISTTEFMAVGVVPQIADDLHTATGAAGLVSSLYATGVAVSTLPVAMTLMHHRPRVLLPMGLALFIAAHAVMALAPTLAVLILGRIMAAAVHSLALGVALSAASAVVAPERRGAAVGLVLGGVSGAMFLGAPLGTALGDLVGWRTSFAIEGAVAVLVLFAVVRTLPDLPGQQTTDRRALQVLWRPQVAKPLLVTLAIMMANGLLFTYLGAYLTDVTGMGGDGVALGLGVFGLAALGGNTVGSWFADRAPRAGSIAAVCLMMLAVALFGVMGDCAPLAYVLIVFWGAGVQAIVPIVTHQAVGAGGGIAAVVGPGAANAGIALGGLAGSAVVSLSGLRTLPWITVSIGAVLAAVLAVEALRDRSRARPHEAT
ncbi:MFS transporter [Streptomyces olivoreticuli]|uniref:MFS transporter n=1 Tax=Streptomyces olivoreticuli TaxID=68246 RepID=UPI000E240032|nr:MFS transporter [Streptomyces olivoreticuli]